MTIVSNTSPVVLLAKIKKLILLKELYNEVLLPPWVKVECIDRGKEQGATDVVEIEKGVRDGWIKLVQLQGREAELVEELVEGARLGRGEAEALALARFRRMKVVLDDKEARAIAEAWDESYVGTITILFESFVQKLISYGELIEDLTKLGRAMWISPEVITDIIRRANEVERKK